MTFQLHEKIEMNVITPKIVHMYVSTVINTLQLLHNQIHDAATEV